MKKRATGLGHITLLWRRFVRNDQVILTILAVLIGVTVAYGTIGFRELLGAVQNLLYGFSPRTCSAVSASSPGGMYCWQRRWAGSPSAWHSIF